MGNVQNIRVYNSSHYVAYTEVTGSSEGGYIHPHGHIVFGVGSRNHNRTVTVIIRDSKSRIIKTVSFPSTTRDYWIIRNDGVKRGINLTTEDAFGPFFRFTDNENYYQMQDRQEAEQKRKKEQERQRKIEEEKRKQEEMRIKQQKEKAEREKQAALEQKVNDEWELRRKEIQNQIAELEMKENNQKWAENYETSQLEDELKELTQATTQFKMDGDARVANHSDRIPINDSLERAISKYFNQNSFPDKSLITSARQELLSKLRLGDSLINNFSSTEIHCVCLDALYDIVICGSTPIFLEFFDALYDTVLNNDLSTLSGLSLVKMIEIINNLLKKWMDIIKGKNDVDSLDELIFGKGYVYPTLSKPLFDPLLVEVDFPNNQNSWPFILKILQVSSERLVKHTTFHNLLVNEFRKDEIVPVNRHIFLEIIFHTLYEKSNPVDVKNFLSSMVATFKGSGDQVAMHWIFKIIDRAIAVNIFQLKSNPISVDLLQFICSYCEYDCSENLSQYVVSIFHHEITDSSEEFNKLASEFLINRAKTLNGNISWEFSPDFVGNLIMNSSKLCQTTIGNVIEFALLCPTYMSHCSEDSLKHLISFIVEHLERDTPTNKSPEALTLFCILQSNFGFRKYQHLFNAFSNTIENFIQTERYKMIATSVRGNINKIITEALDHGYILRRDTLQFLFEKAFEVDISLTSILSATLAYGSRTNNVTKAFWLDNFKSLLERVFVYPRDEYALLFVHALLVDVLDSIEIPVEQYDVISHLVKDGHPPLLVLTALIEKCNKAEEELINLLEFKIMEVVTSDYNLNNLEIIEKLLANKEPKNVAKWLDILAKIKISNENFEVLCQMFVHLATPIFVNQVEPKAEEIYKTFVTCGLQQEQLNVPAVCNIIIALGLLNFPIVMSDTEKIRLGELIENSSNETQEKILHALSFDSTPNKNVYELIVQFEPSTFCPRIHQIQFEHLLMYNSQQGEISNYLIVFLHHSFKHLPSITKDMFSYVLQVLGSTIDRYIKTLCCNLVFQMTKSEHFRNLLPIQLNRYWEILKGLDSLELLAYLSFKVSLYTKFSDEELEKLKVVIDEIQSSESTITKRVTKDARTYFEFTTKLVARNENDSSDNVKWILEWCQRDTESMSNFLKDIENNVPNNTDLETKVRSYCTMAEHNFTMGLIEESDDCLFQAIKLLSNSVDPITEDNISGPNADLYFLILIEKAKMRLLHEDYASAKRFLQIPVSRNHQAALELYQQIEQLESFMKIEFIATDLAVGSVSEKLKSFHELITLYCGVDFADSHIKHFCKTLGLNIFSEAGHQLLELCLSIKENYDVKVIQERPQAKWGQELIRSEFLSACQKRLHKTWSKDADNNFNDMFDSLLIYHDSFLSDNYRILPLLATVLRNFVTSDESLYIEDMLVLLLCLTTEIKPTQSFSEIKISWLRNYFPTVDLSQSEKFCNVLRTKLFASSSQNLTLLNSLINLLPEIISFDEFINLLQFSTMSFLCDLANPLSNKESLRNVIKNADIQHILMRVDSIFRNIFPLGEQLSQRFNEMHENANFLTQTLLFVGEKWDIMSLNNFLTLIEKKMLEVGKEIEEIPEVEQIAVRKKMLGSFCQILYTIYSYKIRGEKSLLCALHDTVFDDWLSFLANKTLLSFYNDEGEKSLETILMELAAENPHNKNLFDVDIHSLMSTIKNLKWKEKDLKSWIKGGKAETADLTEMIEVICQGIQLCFRFSPRKTQIVSFVILLAAPKESNGRLAKIDTGEGKSVIVAMLAAYWALKGKSVDIVTSSPILAQRDAKEFSNFFQLFGLSCGDLEELQKSKGIPKSCYSKNVLYGDASGYEGDILRHEFSLLNTRGERKHDVVIIDEVDSMLIDQGGHSTRLVDKMPAMEHLQSVFIAIYQQINFYMQRLIYFEGQTFLLEEVNNAKSIDYMDVIARVVSSKFNDGVSLKSAIQKFCETAKESESHSDEARNALATLINEEAILLPDSSVPTPESVSSDSNIIDVVISNRWSLNTDERWVKSCEKLLNMNISILAVDPQKGIVYSPRFHNEKQTYSESSVHSTSVYLIEVDVDVEKGGGSKFYHLLPVQDETDLIKSRVKQEIFKMFAISNNNAKEYETLQIPTHLSKLFRTKLDKWILSAITARCHVQENIDYLIKTNESGVRIVVPIDYQSTGVIQEGTVWSDGLHQFLQIKHELAITPEHLATNFISNLSFFSRYKNYIYGLTGTLGSESERNLLSRAYNVDTVNVPQFKIKQHVQMTDIVTLSTENWLSAVTTSVLTHIKQNRSILIICNSISDVQKVEDYMEKHVIKIGGILKNIERYTRSDDEHETSTVSKEMSPGTVIIATNLAGRGTDIKLSGEVVKSGGLYVCITFLPKNLRVEHQAGGRASRQGEPGTSQLIINAEVDGLSQNINELTPQEFRESRDMSEIKRIDKIMLETIPELQFDESVFNSYCILRRSLGTAKYRRTRAAVDERWGLQLDLSKIKTVSQNEFETFFRCLLAEVASGTVIQNPYYEILQGNDYNAKGLYVKARNSFDAAIALDKTHAANAYYYKAFSIIQNFGDNYKNEAAECLEKAAKLIQNVNIACLFACHTMGSKNNRDIFSQENKIVSTQRDDSDFTKQIINKISILQVQLKSIENAFEEIYKHKEVKAEMIGVDNYFQENNATVPQNEIEEYREMGLCGFMKVVNRPPPWYAVFIVILVGFLQAVVGTAIAIFTGGAFGSGMIADGAKSFVDGIVAAASGEYISLKEFFKEKGIAMAISLVCAFAGAVVSSVASTINNVVKMATPTFIKTIGTYVYNTGKSIIGSVKNTLSAIRSSFQKFATKSSFQWIKTIQTKVIGAWNTLKRYVSNARSWVQTQFRTISNQLPSVLTDRQRQYLILTTKLIGGEMINTGIMKGINLLFDEMLAHLMTSINDAIYKRVKNVVESLIDDETNSKILKSFFFCTTNETHMQNLLLKVLRFINLAVSEEIESNKSETAGHILNSIDEFSSEVKRIMNNEANKWGHRNVISFIVEAVCTTIVEATSFGMLIDGIRHFTPTVYERFNKHIQNEYEKQKSDEKAEFTPLENFEIAFRNAKKEIVDRMSKCIAQSITELIRTGLIKKRPSFGVNYLQKKLNPIKRKKVLKELENGDGSGSKSLFDIFKGFKKIESKRIERPVLTENKEDIAIIKHLSASLKMPIFVFNQLEKPKGDNDIPFTPPAHYGVPFISEGIKIGRRHTATGSMYNPIISSPSGSFEALSLGTATSMKDSLLTSVAFQTVDNKPGSIQLMSFSNIFNESWSRNGSSGILQLASFKLHTDSLQLASFKVHSE